jgi:hypothetical protein
MGWETTLIASRTPEKNRIEIVSADFFGPILSYRKIGRFAYRSFSNHNHTTVWLIADILLCSCVND